MMTYQSVDTKGYLSDIVQYLTIALMFAVAAFRLHYNPEHQDPTTQMLELVGPDIK